SAKVSTQLPLLTVHRTVMLVPKAIPVIVVNGFAGFVMEAVPDCMLHCPTPIAGETAAIVKVLLLHCSMLTPASAVVGLAVLLSTSSSKVLPQTTPLLIVQRKVALVPAGTPVIVVVALAGVVIVAVPDSTVHNPVPGAAAFAAMVKFPSLHLS